MTFEQATYKAMALSINNGAQVVVLYIPGNTYHVFSYLSWDSLKIYIVKEKSCDLKLIAIYENGN